MRFSVFTIPIRNIISDPIRSILLTISTGFSVAVLVSILIASNASIRSFEQATSRLGGQNVITIKATHSKIPNIFFSSIYQILQERFYTLSSSKITTKVDNENIKLIGIDVIELSNALKKTYLTEDYKLIESPPIRWAVLSSDLAAKYKLGNKLNISILESKKPLIIAGYVNSQIIGTKTIFIPLDLHPNPYPNLIDLIPIAPINEVIYQELKTDINQIGGLRVQKAEDRSEELSRLTAAFNLNISVLVLITIFVSAFTVYNSTRISLLRKEQEVGALRTFGMIRSHIILIFLLEPFIIGILSGLFGLSLGQPLIGFISSLFLETSAIHFGTGGDLSNSSYLNSPIFWLITVLGSTLATMSGALLPIIQTSKIPPSLNMRVREDINITGINKAFPKFSLFLILCAGVCIYISSTLRLALPAFFGSMCILLSALTATRWLTQVVCEPIWRFLIGFNNKNLSTAILIIRNNIRAGIVTISRSIGISGVGLGVLLGINIMVDSFATTLDSWMMQSFKADIFIRHQSETELSEILTLDDKVVKTAITHPNNLDAYRLFIGPCVISGNQMGCGGADLNIAEEKESIKIISGRFPKLNETSVILSEPAANKTGLNIGDSIPLNTFSINEEGVAKIVGIYRDYSNPLGTVLFPFPVWAKLSGIRNPLSISLYLKNNSSEAVERTLLDFDSFQNISTINKKELFFLIREIFKKTFRITDILQIVVFILVGINILSSKLALNWERRQETKTLFILGLSRNQLRLIDGIEGLIVGIPTILIGTFCGATLAWILINLVNPLSFGWQLNTYISPTRIFLFLTILPLLTTAVSLLSTFFVNLLNTNDLKNYE